MFLSEIKVNSVKLCIIRAVFGSFQAFLFLTTTYLWSSSSKKKVFMFLYQSPARALVKKVVIFFASKGRWTLACKENVTFSVARRRVSFRLPNTHVGHFRLFLLRKLLTNLRFRENISDFRNLEQKNKKIDVSIKRRIICS